MIGIKKVVFDSSNYTGSMINRSYSINLPDYSKVLDISYDDYYLNILYEYDINYPECKILNLWILPIGLALKPPLESYKYFGKIQKTTVDNLDLSLANGGKIPINIREENFYVFSMEIESKNEMRDKKIEETLNE